jgi:hypothetical protein
MMDFSPLPWGEGGESSEPGEGFLPIEPLNFGMRVNSTTFVVLGHFIEVIRADVVGRTP